MTNPLTNKQTNKQIMKSLLLSILMITLLSTSASAGVSSFAGGDGSEGNPYQIETVDQLQNMKLNLSAHYELIKDIDASSTSSWNNGSGFEPIGAVINKFNGSFEGQGYEITGLYINRLNNIGLFGYTDSQSQIKNIGLIDCNVNGSINVGGLVGVNGGNLTQCYTTGNVNGSMSVGGLVGTNMDNLTQCHTTGNVNGNTNVGDLVGVNNRYLIQCYATGNVNGSDGVGGLAGANNRYLIHCYATGNVNGSNDVGGLAGSNSGYLIQCYTAGNVNGNTNVGGITGQNYKPIIQCYATGNVNGSNNVGGLVGLNRQNINQSYATGNVTGSTNLGGLVGIDIGHITQCYWDKDTTGQNTSSGSNNSYGKTTEKMKTESTYVSWNFNHTWTLESSTNDGYPYLLNITYEVHGLYAGGNGTKSNPYQISNTQQLQNMDLNLSSHFVLINDISASETSGWNSGAGFVPVGNSSIKFTGSFDGNGYIISDLYINTSTDYVGLFGYIDQATITNASLEDVNITGNDQVGGLAGRISDSLVNLSYSTGNVEGERYVGGLVGRVNGTVEQSYSTGNITGNLHIGGLAGFIDSGSCSVNQSYSTGSVTGNQDVGGLIGMMNGGIVNQSYSTGYVEGTQTTGGLVGRNYGSVDQCYWNMNTSNQSSSAGGTGLTDLRMKQSSSYENWDFVGTWAIHRRLNDNYPFLVSLIENPPNTAPAVSILTPANNSFISGQFFVNASVIDDHYDPYLSNVTIANSSGEVAGYDDLAWNNLSVLFDSRLLLDGFYNITWEARENESAERYNGSNFSIVGVDNNDPQITFNDETTDGGNYSLDWILGNITVFDGMLNRSAIYLYSNGSLINSSTSNDTTHYVNFTSLADERYQLNASVWDLAGNNNSTLTRDILLDTHDPVVTFNNNTTAQGNVLHSWIFANVTITDTFGYRNLSIVLYNATSPVEEENSSEYHNFTDLSDGRYYLNSTVEDLAGNTNESVTLTYLVDTAKPLVEFNDETTDQGNYSLDWIPGNITVSDLNLNASGIYLYNSTALVNSSISNLTTHDVNFTALEDSWYYLNATVWDLAGNTNETATRTILLDTQEADIGFNSDTTLASNLSQTFIFANVTATDVFGYDNLTIRLYNTSGLLNSSSAEGTGNHSYNFTGLDDGVYYLNATIVDLAGNENETVTRTIILDTTTPLIDFNDQTTDAGNFSQAWALGNITVSDTYLNRSGIYLYNNTGLVNSSTSASSTHEMNFTDLSDGYYQLNATVWDLAGNTNETATRTILLDTQEADIGFNSDTTLASNLSQTFIFANVTATDVFGYDNLTIRLYNTSGLLNSSSAEGTGNHSYNFTGLDDGVYYLNATIVDLAGNENETVTRTIILDTTTPLIDFNDQTTDAGNFSQAWALGNITVSDTYLNRSGIYLYNNTGLVNSSVSSSTTHEMNFTGLSDGYYQLNATVWDLAGNTNETATRTILLDTQEADIGFNSDTTLASNLSQTFIFANVTATDVFGYDNLTIRLYNASGLLNSSSAESTGNHSYNFTGLDDGVYNLNATIVDLAGNENETVTRTIILDTTTPLIDFNDQTTDAGNFSQAWALGNITVSDTYLNRSGIYLYNTTGLVNSSVSSSTTHEMNFTDLSDGYYQLNATVWDLAGNTNETATRTILLDTGVPLISFNASMPAEGNYSRDYLLASLNVSDTFGVSNITFNLYNRSVFGNATSLYNRTVVTTSLPLVNFTSLPTGVYTVNVTVWDLAGNTNNTTSLTYGIDAVDMEINNVVAQTQDTSARIIWNTNEIANSIVYYGRDMNVTYNVSEADFEINHSIRLSGLKDDTLYYYKVVCCDPLGFNNSTQVLNFTTERTIVDDGRPYYYPQNPEPEGGDEGDGQDNDPNTGSVPDQKVEVNVEGGEAGDTVNVDITGGDEDDQDGAGDDSMVTGIDIELGSDVEGLGVSYSQSSASS